MCSMIAVAIGAEGAATVMKGVAAKQQGEAEKRADYLSADMSERSAADAVERGKLKDMQVVLHSSAVVAEQRVIQSATGADLTVGSPKAVQEGTAGVSDVDRAVVQRNAALEAYGLRSRARTQRQRGVNAEAAGNAAMMGTFLSGIGKVGSQIAMVGAGKTDGGDVGDTSYGGGSEPDEAD